MLLTKGEISVTQDAPDNSFLLITLVFYYTLVGMKQNMSQTLYKRKAI